MPRDLKLYITVVVAASVIALGATTFVIPVDPLIGQPFESLGPYAKGIGLLFWTLITLVASALPVRMPRGTLVGVSIAPLIAATVLGGPTAGAWVALLGTTEMREVRGRIPWYGTLANHAGIVLPTVAAGLVMLLFGVPGQSNDIGVTLVASMLGSAAFFAINASLTATLISLRTSQRFETVLLGDARGFATSLLGLAPVGWLMAQMYSLAWWASL